MVLIVHLSSIEGFRVQTFCIMSGGASENGPEKPKPSLLKLAALQIVAGGSAGFVEVCIMHPLDLVKTRLQIQSKKAVGVSATSTGSQVCILSAC